MQTVENLNGAVIELVVDPGVDAITLPGRGMQRASCRAVDVLSDMLSLKIISLLPSTPSHVERQSLAVLLADIVGYTRLIERDDLKTALRVRYLRRRLIEPAVLAHGGRLVDQVGDGTLMAFPFAEDALECAVTIQKSLHVLEQALPAEDRIQLRMGISADEVLVIDGDLYGRAVNTAARLTELAEPGGIHLSGRAFDQVRGRSPIRCEALGRRHLRNIAEPVRVFRVAPSELGQTTADLP